MITGSYLVCLKKSILLKTVIGDQINRASDTRYDGTVLYVKVSEWI